MVVGLLGGARSVADLREEEEVPGLPHPPSSLVFATRVAAALSAIRYFSSSRHRRASSFSRRWEPPTEGPLPPLRPPRPLEFGDDQAMDDEGEEADADERERMVVEAEVLRGGDHDEDWAFAPCRRLGCGPGPNPALRCGRNDVDATPLT